MPHATDVVTEQTTRTEIVGLDIVHLLMLLSDEEHGNLLLFQLLALYHAFDYQYLTQLFPLEKGEKEKGLKQIVLGVGSAVLLLELLVGAVVFQEKIALLALVGAGLFLQLFYLPYQLKRLVDE